MDTNKQLMRENWGSLLLVDMTDQRRFDLQFEFVVFIIHVCLVVLQTGSERNQNPCVVVYFGKLHYIVQITGKKHYNKNLLCEKEEAVIR